MANQHQPLLPRLVLLAALCGATAGAPTVQAQSADALLDKLVEKGVLTADEATGLRDEADKGFTTAFAAKSGMPDWVTALKINGDLRTRYEGFTAPNPLFVERNRFRYRMRLGIVANIADDFEVGMRLTSSEPASGGTGGDPVSGNTSFSGNGAKKFVYLDLAYAKWNPIHNADWLGSLTAGKMENPFVFPSTIMFDKDYTPEGAAIDLTYRINPDHALRAIGGGFAVNELGGSSNDPYLVGSQLRFDSTWDKKLASSVGVGTFGVLARDVSPGKSPLNTDQFANQQRGNTRDGAGNPKAGFNPVYADASVTYMLESFPFNTGTFPVTVSGDFLHNPSVSKDNDGYSTGITLGKAGKKGTWELSYRYTALQADAWFEEFTESDFGAYYSVAPVGGAAGYGAGTNVRGHVVKGSYSPYDSLTFSVTLFATQLINNVLPAGAVTDVDSQMYRIQVDAVWKF